MRKHANALSRMVLAAFCLTLCLGLSMRSTAQKRTVHVAAAADLKFAMAELAQKFEAKSGQKLDVTYGSSGNFFSQINNGAPFDVFFSADVEYPRRLAAAGAAEGPTLYEYAVGRIIIWTPPDSKVDPRSGGWQVLRAPEIQKIAIANPEHAPYGKAAVAAMQKAGIYEQLKAKLVYGENISQAAQFVQSGSAQAGIIALSLAVSPAMKDGHSWTIPAEMHPPIEQAAIVLHSAANKDGATAFLEFVKGAEGRKILESFGFRAPDSGEQKK